MVRALATDFRTENAVRARRRHPGTYPVTPGGWVMIIAGEYNRVWGWVGELIPQTWIDGVLAVPVAGPILVSAGGGPMVDGRITPSATRFVVLEEEPAPAPDEVATEQGRWREAIFARLQRLAPGSPLEDPGADGGDPLAAALSAIEQAFSQCEIRALHRTQARLIEALEAGGFSGIDPAFDAVFQALSATSEPSRNSNPVTTSEI